MAAAELAFEYFALALETTRGTAITTPTHVLPMVGTLTPVRTKYRPDEARGTLEAYYRSKTVRSIGQFDISGPADPNYLPVLSNMFSKAYSTFTTPTNGVLTRLFTSTPTINADDLKMATLFFGDPNVQIFRSAWGACDEFTISADASGEDGVTWQMTGQAYYPELVAAPTFPASIAGDLLVPGATQLWIDSGVSAIGTTAVTGRFVKAEVKITTGVTYKYYANGPTGGLNFTKTGRTKRWAEASITVELNEASIAAGKEYLLYSGDTPVKMRIRFNGDLIESVTPDYYSYIQVDAFGPLDAFAWDTAFESNRTMTFTVTSEYDSTAGASWVIAAQSERTAL